MNQLKLITALFLCTSILLSCSHTDESNEFSNDPDLKPLKKKIEQFLSVSDYLIVNADTIIFSDSLFSIYKTRQFEPLWFEARSKIQLKNKALDLFTQAHLYGLDTALFFSNVLRDTLADWKKDVLMTRNYMLLNAIMKHGATVASDHNLDSLLHTCHFSTTLFTAESWQYEDWMEVIAQNEPQSKHYRRLKKEIAAYVKLHRITDTTFEFASFKDDSVLVYQQASKALVYHQFLTKKDTQDSSKLIKAIQAFQLKNGLKDDALLGKYSQKALNKSHFDHWVQLAVNMERCRTHQIYDDEYLHINIPSYTLRWIKADSIFRTHKVITGSPETPTPEFYAQLRSIVLYPTWHVPFSISTKEILPALRRDTNYLAKKGYSLHTSTGDSVNPYGIQWSQYSERYFPFRIRQIGGKSNSLGVIKFLFPNKHSVYLHDTPAKYLFTNNIRAYSHGCIRLEDPLTFGAALIEREIDTNLITADSLRVLIDSSITQVFPIRKPLVVYIDYRTIDPFETGSVIYLTDIYDRDRQWWERMKYKPKKQTQIAEL